jgi:hypothetical protein
LFGACVQMMPNMIVTCAKRRQGQLSFWHAQRAFGIVKEIF